MHLSFLGAGSDLRQSQGILIPRTIGRAGMARESAIGELLVRAGLIDSSGLLRAQEAQKREGISLSKAIVTLGLANEQSMIAAIAKTMQIEFLSAELPEVSNDVASLLPAAFCRKRMVVPLSLQGKRGPRHSFRQDSRLLPGSWPVRRCRARCLEAAVYQHLPTCAPGHGAPRTGQDR